MVKGREAGVGRLWRWLDHWLWGCLSEVEATGRYAANGVQKEWRCRYCGRVWYGIP